MPRPIPSIQRAAPRHAPALSGGLDGSGLVELSAQMGCQGDVFGICAPPAGRIRREGPRSASTSSERRCSLGALPGRQGAALSGVNGRTRWRVAATRRCGSAPSRRPGAGGSSRLPPDEATGCSRWARCCPPCDRGGWAGGCSPQPYVLPSWWGGADPLHPCTITDANSWAPRSGGQRRGWAADIGSWSRRGLGRRADHRRSERTVGSIAISGRWNGCANRSSPQRSGGVRARVGAGDLSRPGGDPW